MILDEKKALRQRLLAERRALTRSEVIERSRQVHARAWASGIFNGAKTAALYAAADSEVRTRPLFERLRAEGKSVVLPRVRGAGPEIDFFPVEDWERLLVSARGIPEPEPAGEPTALSRLDVVIVPGIAFDRKLGRLGYGLGCYDRALAGTRPEAVRAGIGFDFQVVEAVPAEAHDVQLSMVIVESRVILPPEEGARLIIKEKGELSWK